MAKVIGAKRLASKKWLIARRIACHKEHVKSIMLK